MSCFWKPAAIVMLCMVLGCAHRASVAPSAAAPGEIVPPAGAGAVPLSAPGGAGAPPDSAGAAYAALDRARAGLPGLRASSDSTQAGGSRVDWTAYFDRDSLRFVRETIEIESYGKRTNEYVFEGGRLRVFASRGEHALTGPPTQRGPYRLRIAFDPAGGVIASEKFISEAQVPLEPSEPPAALGRADWLRGLIHPGGSSGH
jgi:hypothetical protein